MKIITLFKFIGKFLSRSRKRQEKIEMLIGVMQRHEHVVKDFNGHRYLIAYIPGCKLKEPPDSIKLSKKFSLNLHGLPESDDPFNNVDMHEIQQILLINPHIILLNLYTEPFSELRGRGLYKIVRLK